jgi:NADH dehydrogenase [ubiquinone] 1 alpha subcomplex assembly factor 1
MGKHQAKKLGLYNYLAPSIIGLLGGYYKVIIKLKGDGKEYQFRIKNNRNTYYSYITNFKTTGDWETIIINLKDLYPSFRGQTMNIPNFTGDSFEEIVFLIGNKKNESFALVLDRIDIE